MTADTLDEWHTSNDVEEARDLAKLHLFRTFPGRWAHVVGVAKRAELAVAFLGDSEGGQLVAAAFLHDIGYSPALVCTGMHGVDGANFLRSRGWSSRICGLVAHHSCASKEAELRGVSSELSSWSDERSALRDALWWADMTTGPRGELVNVHDRINEVEARYGSKNIVALSVRHAEPELVAAVERTEARLRAAGVEVR